MAKMATLQWLPSRREDRRHPLSGFSRFSGQKWHVLALAPRDVPKIGHVRLDALKEALAQLGLSLGVRLDNWPPS